MDGETATCLHQVFSLVCRGDDIVPVGSIYKTDTHSLRRRRLGCRRLSGLHQPNDDHIISAHLMTTRNGRRFRHRQTSSGSQGPSPTATRTSYTAALMLESLPDLVNPRLGLALLLDPYLRRPESHQITPACGRARRKKRTDSRGQRQGGEEELHGCLPCSSPRPHRASPRDPEAT